MQYFSVWRVLTPIIFTSLLVACGGSSSSSSSNSSNDTQASLNPANNTPNNSAGGGIDSQPNKPKGKLVAARHFATDTRTKSRDGIKGLQPILSRAPKSCKATGTLTGSGPKCEDFKKPEFFSVKNGNTWIDAQVFVPKHHEGESLPVIVHSHGWAGTKLNKLAKLPKCEAKDKPYNCPIKESKSILGVFKQADELLADLYQQGYIIVSFSQRGFGKSEGDVTIMNPYLETQDAIAVLDWIAVQGKAGRLPIEVDANNDFKLGLLGGSYGGGFQFPLAALDKRADALVPIGTWNSLRNSLFPNNVVKSGWGNLLCVAASFNRKHPLLTKSCAGMMLAWNRTTDKLDPTGELVEFISMNGLDYFRQLEEAQKPFQEGQPAFKMRPVDTLLIQGSRDVLFPLNEGLNNYKYLQQAGGDVRLLTNEGGHINPMAGQAPGGKSHCGNVNIFRAIRIWFDVKLRDADSALLTQIPKQCISLENDKSVVLDAVPNLNKNTQNSDPKANEWRPFKVSVGVLLGVDAIDCNPVYTVPADSHQVLAGQSWLRETEVSDRLPLKGGAAYMGLCIERDERILLVDDAITAFAEGSYQAETQFVSVGASLKAGDKVGVYATKTNGNMEFLSMTSIDNIFGFVGDLAIPEKSPELLKLQDFHKHNLNMMAINAFSVQGEIKLPIIDMPN